MASDFNSFKKSAIEYSGETLFTNAFPQFCLKVFFNEMLSEEDIQSAVDGLGTNDDSIDAYWCTETDKQVHIAQFKSIQKESEFSKASKTWFTFLSGVEAKLKDDNYISKHKNRRIRDDIANDFRYRLKNNYEVKKYLFHLGQCGEELLAHHADIQYFGFDQIIDKWKEYDSIYNTIEPSECDISIDYKLKESPSSVGRTLRCNPTSKYSTVVTIVSAQELIALRHKYLFQLFDKNIRHYLGSSNRINKEIVETAKNMPDNFYYYNNGITITCRRCKDSMVNDTARLKLEMPQIINGAQTVNALYDAYVGLLKKKKAEFGSDTRAQAECDKHFSRIKVLCRIIESPRQDDIDFSNNLTRYNNSQNAVKPIDFYSNRPEQEQLQKRLLTYGFYYERKRGEKLGLKAAGNILDGTDISKLQYSSYKIDLKVISSVLQAVRGKPGLRDVGEKFILSSDNNEYSDIFGDKRSVIDDSFMRRLVLSLCLFFPVQDVSKSYSKARRFLNETDDLASGDYKEFLQLIEPLVFLPERLRKDLSNKTDDYLNLVKRLHDYQLLSQGKYLITSLLFAIIEKNQLTNRLYSDGSFKNMEYMKANIVDKWLNKLILKIINPIRKQEKDTRSDSAFFLDSSVYSNALKYLSDLVYQDNLELEKEYPL
jgi:hypothetical protein